MMTWNVCLVFWIRSISLILLLTVVLGVEGKTQSSLSLQNFVPPVSSFNQDSTTRTEVTYPNPKMVLRRSLIIPGWGQITNKQAWKVPIVYGLIGGLSYYSVVLHKNYHDYRAAFYNQNPNTPDDFKFGPTPDYIPENSDLNSLRTNRNSYRNRRDFIYITIVLAYALNAIDAYVFAHLRSFDVSDDLSMNASVQPLYLASSRYDSHGIGMSVSFNF